jgi:hypothetical protein
MNDSFGDVYQHRVAESTRATDLMRALARIADIGEGGVSVTSAALACPGARGRCV